MEDDTTMGASVPKELDSVKGMEETGAEWITSELMSITGRLGGKIESTEKEEVWSNQN